MSGTLQFSLGLGLLLQEHAMEAWEAKGGGWLRLARQVAEELATANGRVTIDNVLAVIGLPDELHHNVAGVVFKKGFMRVGFTPTHRPEGHGRMIGVWTLVDNKHKADKETS